MTSWCRMWHGFSTHRKWPVIARKTGQPIERVIYVAMALIETASADADRGSVARFDAEEFACYVGCETSDVEMIVSALGERGWIVNGRIASWDEHQPVRDLSGAARRSRSADDGGGARDGRGRGTQGARDHGDQPKRAANRQRRVNQLGQISDTIGQISDTIRDDPKSQISDTIRADASADDVEENQTVTGGLNAGGTQGARKRHGGVTRTEQSRADTEALPLASKPPPRTGPDLFAAALDGEVIPPDKPGKPPPPPTGSLKDQLFGPALAALAARAGKAPGACRSFVGSLVRDVGEAQALDLIMASERESAIDPMAWINKAKQVRSATNGQRRANSGRTVRSEQEIDADLAAWAASKTQHG